MQIEDIMNGRIEWCMTSSNVQHRCRPDLLQAAA